MILNRTFACYNKIAYKKDQPLGMPPAASGADLGGPSLHTEGYGHSLTDSRILGVSLLLASKSTVLLLWSPIYSERSLTVS